MKTLLILFFLFSFCISFAQTNTNYTISEKKGKFGYLKPNSKKWAIKPQFDGVLAFGEHLDSNSAFAKKDTLWGVIDKTGKWVVVPTYEAIFEYETHSRYKSENSNLFKNSLLGRCGNKRIFLDKKGDTLTSSFDYVSRYDKENSFAIHNNNKVTGLYQYLDNGLVRKVYGECDKVAFLSKDVLVVSKLVNGKMKQGLYNISSGKSTSIENDNIYILPYNPTYYILKNNSLKGVLDKNFSVILPTEYNSIGNFYGTLSLALKENKNFLLDNNFKLMFDNKYDYEFIDLDKDGYTRSTYNIDSIRYYVLKKDDIYGVYNKNKIQIMPYALQEVSVIPSYNDKDAFVIFKQNNRKGILNVVTGEILVKPIYDELYYAYGFENWCLTSEMNTKLGRIYAEKNKIVEIKPIYDKKIKATYMVNNAFEEEDIWYLNNKKFVWNDKMRKFSLYVEKKQAQIKPELAFALEPEQEIYDVRRKEETERAEEIYIIPKVEACFEINRDYFKAEQISLEDFVIRNMKYPQKAIDNKIEGIVEMEITIGKEFCQFNAKITKGLGYGCDEEAIRIVNATTYYYWKPAQSSKQKNTESLTSIKRLKIAFKLPKKRNEK